MRKYVYVNKQADKLIIKQISVCSQCQCLVYMSIISFHVLPATESNIMSYVKVNYAIYWR